MSALNQLNVQFRTKTPMDRKTREKLEQNLATVIVGAAAEVGVLLVLTEGPLGVTHHEHDAQSNAYCQGCLQLAQDGLA